MNFLKIIIDKLRFINAGIFFFEQDEGDGIDDKMFCKIWFLMEVLVADIIVCLIYVVLIIYLFCSNYG